MCKPLLALCCAMALCAGCAVPLSPDILDRIDPGLDFATVKADPQRFAGAPVMLGGSIANLRSDDHGSLLELLRWDLTRWGEPLALAEEGDRFVVQTTEILDHNLYARGRLVTLAATLRRTIDISVEDRDAQLLLFDLLEIHLWDTPFHYGLHPNPDPGAPEYVAPTAPGPDHPYDPTPWDYPYPPHFYRNK